VLLQSLDVIGIFKILIYIFIKKFMVECVRERYPGLEERRKILSPSAGTV
jgi:uncharacterized membrane protein